MMNVIKIAKYTRLGLLKTYLIRAYRGKNDPRTSISHDRELR
jgi:hypothetical protein